MKNLLIALGCLASLCSGPPARAQGVQTGTITGTVQSADGQPLPGVTVTATSPALQGPRTAVTDVNGVYFIKGLPAGPYAVAFDLSSFRSEKQENVAISVGSTVAVSQTMTVTGGVETVLVVGEARPAALTRPTLSQAYVKTELEAMPVGPRPRRSRSLRQA